jgi:hypothetical protein
MIIAEDIKKVRPILLVHKSRNHFIHDLKLWFFRLAIQYIQLWCIFKSQYCLTMLPSLQLCQKEDNLQYHLLVVAMSVKY